MSDAPRSSFMNTLGWGAYFACSWTWCIGMFLPVLMIRDFGWWSFAVFAIPNCVGAAAMGWVMKKPGTSEAVVAAHGKAIRAFSLVTIMFQAFFFYAIPERGPGRPVWLVLAAFAAGAVFGVLASQNKKWRHAGSFLSLLLSIGLLAWFLVEQGGLPDFPQRPNDFKGLGLLAPVCIFGFALSPYLDPTFHRAAQSDVHASIPARFGFGFLMFFPIMLAFTAMYAGSLIGDAQPGTFGSAYHVLAPLPVLLHIASQLVFTMAVQSCSLRDESQPTSSEWSKPWGWGFGVVIALMLAMPFITASATRVELTYRLFMSFYGLIFPAYVWICMLPTLRAPVKPSERRLIGFGVSVICAAPFYYLGFISLQYWALAPGVMIPLVAGLLVRKEPREGASSAAVQGPR